jgi:hypothetical protein
MQLNKLSVTQQNCTGIQTLQSWGPPFLLDAVMLFSMMNIIR